MAYADRRRYAPVSGPEPMVELYRRLSMPSPSGRVSNCGDSAPSRGTRLKVGRRRHMPTPQDTVVEQVQRSRRRRPILRASLAALALLLLLQAATIAALTVVDRRRRRR